MHLHSRKKNLIMLFFCLKLIFIWVLRKQSPRQKIICYYNIRECNRRQIQVRQKKSKMSEERRANLRAKAGYHLVLIAAVCLTSWISEAVWIMGFRAVFSREWSTETLSSMSSVPLVKVYPHTALSYSVRALALGPALCRVIQHWCPSLAAPAPARHEAPWNLRLTSQKAHQIRMQACCSGWHSGVPIYARAHSTYCYYHTIM